MADNIAIATGSAGGSGSIATDQLATGEHVQFMKLMDGTLDSTNKAVVNASGQLSVIQSTALPAGTNMIGNFTGSILSIINPLPAGTNMIGNVTSSCLAIINPLPAGTNKIGTVDIATAVATAKGTQGANALPVQDLKDAGRTSRTFILDSFAVAVATEALMTLSGSAGFAAPVANTAFSASAGKTLRIQSIAANIHTIAGNTTAVNVIIRIRAQSGTAIVTSPVQWITSIQGVAAANSAGVPVDLSFPDGWELPSGVSFGITTTCAGFVATTAAPKVDITLTAYEY